MTAPRRTAFQRALVLVATVALTWGILTVGTDSRAPNLQAGMPSPQEFRAERAGRVVDEAETERRREQAAAQVETVYEARPEVERTVYENVASLFTAVRAGVYPEPVEEEPPPTPETTVPGTTETTTAEGQTTETTLAEGEAPTTTVVETVTVAGQVVLDGNGDGEFNPEDAEALIPDVPYPRIRVLLTDVRGTTLVAETDQSGTYTTGPLAAGAITVQVDASDPDLPQVWNLTLGALPATVECAAGAECVVDPIGIAPAVRPIEEQVADLAADFPDIEDGTLETLAVTATRDVVRAVLGDDQQQLRVLRESVIGRLQDIFARGIRSTDDERQEQQTVAISPPVILGADGFPDAAAQAAAAEIIISNLRQNVFEDAEATEQARREAREAVEPFEREYERGQLIVGESERLEPHHIAAIAELTTDPIRLANDLGRLAVIVVTVGIIAFYLSRFRPLVWERPRLVSLFGMLLVLAAAAVRGTTLVQPQSSWYVLPAVAFGYLAAVLFDARMGTLMALTLAILTAVGTSQAGPTAFAALATMAPIGFVSAVSSRRAFRNSVVTSGLTVAVAAGALSWFFDVGPGEGAWQVVGINVAWALGSAVVAALVALAAMPFFESMFDITTTLRLLELTDRNHEALQKLQAEAFGTFNHSLMVGTLADAAARAIGADNLLARAAAYYHDLGKTRNPSYFIENQFGISNPHDDLPPEKSAEVIRQHVIDGVELARQFGIPSEVAEGIVSHHGDAIMRYFYEKARQAYGDENVHPDDYRHAGHKPRRAEMAILMLADSVEGACRAVFSKEDPTPDAIAKVVNTVIDEKVADGQLSEASLTLGQLTAVRRAFIEALVGHYHHRIPYPNFPGT